MTDSGFDIVDLGSCTMNASGTLFGGHLHFWGQYLMKFSCHPNNHGNMMSGNSVYIIEVNEVTPDNQDTP